MSLEEFEGQTPESVLERIQVGNSVWCLVKFPERAEADESFLSNHSTHRDEDEDEEYHHNSTIWLTQDELIDHVNSIGCTLDLPPFSLSSGQAAQLVRA